MTKTKSTLSETQDATIAMLVGMGKSEQEARQYIARQTIEQTRTKQPQKPTVRRELRDSAGKRTVYLMTATQSATFDMVRGMGRNEKQALELVETQAGGKFADEDQRRAARRSAFANLNFRPRSQPREMSSLARLLTEHNAQRQHDAACCPACCARGGAQ